MSVYLGNHVYSDHYLYLFIIDFENPDFDFDAYLTNVVADKQ
jgi:hypothetical protein